MDINQMPGELSRAVHLRLMSSRDFDTFVLQMLWFRLSLRTKEVLECSKALYFGEIQAAETWRVPALVIISSGAALLAQPRYREQLLEVATHCKALTCCDRVHILGSDTGIRLWFDYTNGQWHQQTMPLPADWHTEEG